ncbi:MAG: succinylglutamate desuccinylase/aspartoacylase family protein [Planctomycetes bacterium]|nr:succinylglutamate desuccinylase/aspartoacylase family protein [Planctomycetota bacterium]
MKPETRVFDAGTPRLIGQLGSTRRSAPSSPGATRAGLALGSAGSPAARGEPDGGPLLLVTAAIHGNEPAGVHALRRVFARLEELQPVFRGRFVGLIGNLAALVAGQRYEESDMNRLWSKRALAELAAADPALDKAERKQQRELLAAIETELAQARGEVVHFDLHSTSGDSPPFLVQNEDARSWELARELGVPVLRGLLKNLDGTVLDFGAARGFTSIVLEGGQNEAESTIEHHESALWMLLVSTGVVEETPAMELAAHKLRIARSTSGIPAAVEIVLRYAIEPSERFTMLPGFKSFEHVVQGQLLALGGPSGQRPIRSPMSGILIMPRYQGQGHDGFFLARPSPVASVARVA